MFKLNHINKISPYFLEQSDVINNIIIENDDIHPILVTFENLTLSSKNKIQFAKRSKHKKYIAKQRK